MPIISGDNENNRWMRKCDTRCVVMRWSKNEVHLRQ